MEENRFEKLEVWKRAHQIVINIYKITRSFPKEEKYLLVDQLRRASISIAANIAEGNDRKTKKEFIQFLYNSKGSLSEVKYFCILTRDLNYIDINTYVKLISELTEVGKMINGLINYLRSKIKNI